MLALAAAKSGAADLPPESEHDPVVANARPLSLDSRAHSPPPPPFQRLHTALAQARENGRQDGKDRSALFKGKLFVFLRLNALALARPRPGCLSDCDERV